MVSVMVQYVKPTAQVYFLVKPWMGGLGRMLSLQGSDITRAYKKSFRSLLAGVMQNAISTLLKWTLFTHSMKHHHHFPEVEHAYALCETAFPLH